MSTRMTLLVEGEGKVDDIPSGDYGLVIRGKAGWEQFKAMVDSAFEGLTQQGTTFRQPFKWTIPLKINMPESDQVAVLITR